MEGVERKSAPFYALRVLTYPRFVRMIAYDTTEMSAVNTTTVHVNVVVVAFELVGGFEGGDRGGR